MRSICLRLRRGDDLLLSIRQLAAREGLRCAVVLSGVGCVTEARVRDASGVTVRHIAEPTRQAESSYAVFCLKKKIQSKRAGKGRGYADDYFQNQCPGVFLLLQVHGIFVFVG